MHEGVRGARRSCDRLASAEPLDRDRAEAVGVCQRPGDFERVPLAGGGGAPGVAREIGDGHRAGDGIVDVGNGAGGDARDRFGGPQRVGLGGASAKREADVGLGERVGDGRGAGDRLAITEPCPGDCAEAVGVGEVLGRGEGVSLVGGGGATGGACQVGKRDGAGDRIVDVCNRAGGGAHHRFGRTEGVGLGGPGPDREADVSLGEGVAGPRCSADRLLTSQPCPADRAEAVDVVEILGGCERVPLLWRCGSARAAGDVRDSDRSGDGIVDVGNRAGGGASR